MPVSFAAMPGPLTGIRVVDLTRVFSGPFGSVMLADLGANVIKVEARQVGDVFRHMGGYQRGGLNGLFLGLNRGKRSIAVDLSTPEGQEVVRNLASDADVLMENFRPGVLSRLGLAPEVLHETNPRLIIASITGFGPDGPSAADPAYDPILQGRSGIVSRQKMSAEAEPDVVRSFVSDKLGGFFAAQSILAALVARANGASGQVISVSLLDASVYYMWADVMQEVTFVGEGVIPGRILAYQRFINETKDGYIVQAAVSLEDRQRLAIAVGRPELNEDPRYSTMREASKPDNYLSFNEEIAAALKTMTTADGLKRLRELDVAVAEVAEPADVLTDPHVQATGFVKEVEHPTAGTVRQPSYPASFTVTAPQTAGPAPTLGQHTTEILKEAGFDDERIAALIDSGVVG
jgi:crotonobetainyl-CoA:carnitine CoA-transferase CaiB-like acyl-CoA transferase